MTGDLEGALGDHSRALELRPDDVSVLVNRALIRYELGHAVDAVEDFTRVMEVKGEDLGFLAQRGRARALGGDREGAVADFHRAAALGGQIQQALWLAGFGGETAPLAALADGPEWQALIARHYLGRVSAREVLTAAVGDEGRLCEAHCYLALLAERGGDYAGAADHYRQVLEHPVEGYVEVIWARLRLAQLESD